MMSDYDKARVIRARNIKLSFRAAMKRASMI